MQTKIYRLMLFQSNLLLVGGLVWNSTIDRFLFAHSETNRFFICTLD